MILLLSIPGLSGFSALTDSYSWEFNNQEELKGWRGEGVETTGIYQGFFRILGQEQFQLISPPYLGIPVREDPYLRIRYLFRSPRYLRVFRQSSSEKPVLLPESYYLFDCRLKYYLYLRHVESKKTKSFYENRPQEYSIVYNAPQLAIDPIRGQIDTRET